MRHFTLRFLSLLLGIFLYSVGIALAIKASIGYAPWEVFHAGLGITIGLSIGTASIIVGIVVVVMVTVFGEKVGFGTLMSMVLTGVFLDAILRVSIIPQAQNYFTGIIMLIIGLFVIALGSYFYIKSAFGVGPRDNLMIVLTRKTKLPVGVCRSVVELTVVLAGWCLGGMIGYGTVISAVMIGFCIQVVFKLLKFDTTAVEHETIAQTLKSLYQRKG
ncbi:MAG: hypothetical protein FWH42_02935 [Dehalococcoidia bacterium]|nr:hypothetical protein [Dehalococcoidia bacterium]